MNPQFTQSKGSVSKETNKDSIARKFGCKKSEVTYAKAGQSLAGYKVIYDMVSQRSYAIPSNLGSVTLTSLTDGVLTHSGGTADLGALAVLRGEFVTLVENFTSGFTIRVKNELVSDGVSMYRWGGTLPKTVNAGGTIDNSGGLGDTKWIMVAKPQSNMAELYPYYTPEQFLSPGQAFKDGVNDDAILINKALNFASSIGGGIVWLSKGDYYQDSQILIPENCTLRGSGMFATTINALDSMDKKLNSITSKNNLMYLYGAGTDHPDYTDYTFIEGVVVEDLGVNANHLGRDPGRAGLTTSVQACGIKLTSAKNSRISRCFVTHAILHGFDISAMTYFNDGDPTHNLPGGSQDCLVENCVGMNSLYDDIFTCHNSSFLKFKNCFGYNDRTDPNMLWENNQHAFEIDEGNHDIVVEDCRAQGLMCGFQAKGHSDTYPAQGIVFRRCHAIDCAWSFQTDHRNYMTQTDKPQISRGVIIEDCTSQNANNDRYMVGNDTYRARAIWLRSYDGVVVRNFTIINGNGVIEIENGAKNILVDGVIWKGVYTGSNNNTRNIGLVNVVSNGTKGNIKICNIFLQDPLNIPVVRHVDTSITAGIVIDNITGVGNSSASDTPCVFMTLNTPNTVKNIRSSGYAAALIDSSGGAGWSTYLNDLDFSIDNGVCHMRTPDVPVGATHPARVGNIAVSKTTGKLYSVVGTTINSSGTWSLVGVQTP